MLRKRVNASKDKRYFSRTANKVNKRNIGMPMRGGIRL